MQLDGAISHFPASANCAVTHLAAPAIYLLENFSLKFGLDNGRNSTTLIAKKKISFSGLFLPDGGCFLFDIA
ncbi:MAG TPA: hypothetical protein VKT33_08900 [Candidatus Angelobacter sp.]|nr:hypothetical protein [Candidatus Angelobacter sp.]